MELSDKVYAMVRQIPKGSVSTYQAVAVAAGDRLFARAVGNILNHNPNLAKVPCHRVVRSDSRVGGYSYGADAKSNF